MIVQNVATRLSKSVCARCLGGKISARCLGGYQVTNYKITARNVIALANEGGRTRWKVENEGFNVQKNGGYALEHAYTEDTNAAKVFYFLLQIAHMLAQLMDKGSLLKKAFPAGFGSVKNLSFRLLEAWRNARLTKADFNAMLPAQFQIRFDSS